MKSATVKAYAKINITLNVTGVENGYHNLDTVVVTVDKFDKVTVTKRKDDKILLNLVGKYANYNFIQENFNAYKAALKFKEKFNTCGVTVTVERNIPEGSGMGGSSADIAGTLMAMQKLFNVTESVKDIADALGSDSGYLLEGGFARLTGRGDVIEKIDSDWMPYFVVIYSKTGVNTKECFSSFDTGDYKGVVADNNAVVDCILNHNLQGMQNKTGNALTSPAVTINSEVKENLNELLALSPVVADMTGSGATVFAMYDSYEMASWALSKLTRKYGSRVELLYTRNPNYKPFIEGFLERFSLT
ncbi:MAG: 4-(cytidine 5'-diphospho)-2-C-methyl-D-erythritol kinase [Clostridia bacterium]|nr:4-(cytidine 5'-diphospho)-2-C-methyl-D-erythritol kinase [Clostridia bacterium]